MYINIHNCVHTKNGYTLRYTHFTLLTKTNINTNKHWTRNTIFVTTIGFEPTFPPLQCPTVRRCSFPIVIGLISQKHYIQR